MTERRVIGSSPFRRALALTVFLASALAPAASLAAEAPPAAGCDAQSMVPLSAPAAATDSACLAPDLERDQAYLVETARPGATMLHQGLAVAIARLHPMFVRRLAGAISEARAAGLPSAGIFSAYRPPAFGVGGFSDKFSSLHTYGLAVDLLGVGRPGSSEANLWYEIAARHGIVCPYGAGNRREWNHCQPTSVKSIMAGDPLRGTVSPQGPIDREAMFAMGNALVDATDAGAGSTELPPATDEQSLSRYQAQPWPRIGADASHGSHRRGKTVAVAAAGPDPHQARGQPKHRILGENASANSGLDKRYRTASLVRRDAVSASHSPASSREHAPAKRIDAQDARLARTLKGICRGC